MTFSNDSDLLLYFFLQMLFKKTLLVLNSGLPCCGWIAVDEMEGRECRLLGILLFVLFGFCSMLLLLY